MPKYVPQIKRVLHTNQFGFDIFIAPISGLGIDGIEITNNHYSIKINNA